MGDAILIGDNLITRPSAIEFVDFRAWTQRGNKNYRRFFSPYVVVKIGSYQIIFDGYDSVWELIDSFHNDLPRNGVNAAMKGDTLNEEADTWSPFIRDLEALAKESKTRLINITLSKCNVSQLRLVSSGEREYWLGKSVEKITPLKNGRFETTYNDKNGSRKVATSALSNGSCVVLTQRINRNRIFVCGILMRGMLGSVRPRRGEFVDSEEEAKQYSKLLMSELKAVPRSILKSQRVFPLSAGLRSQEADAIEHSRWNTILSESFE